ncbi:MAG: MFS transporter [Pseudomonadales bacterium]|jgi:Na+/melibiose symporter-like transporter
MSATSRPPLSFLTKLTYGFGQAGEGLKNGAFGVFVFFYYNQVLALPGTLAGLAVGIALVFDAITDPMAGSLSDNWRSKLGRRHPFMFLAALPLGVSFVLLFSPPDGLGQFGLFLWLLTFAVLTRAAMTVYHVPHIALGAELTNDFEERTTVVAFRQFFSTFGQLAAYVVGFTLFFYSTPDLPRGQFRVGAYAPFAVAIAVCMATSILVSAFGTRSQIPYLPQPKGPPEKLNLAGMSTRMFREIGEALSNRSFAWLFSGVLIVFMMVGVDSALNLHMNTYFWELSPAGNTLFFTAYPIGVMLGTLVARRLNQIFDKKPSIVFGTAWWALCQIVPVVLRIFGWFPENGTDALLITLVCIKFVQGVGVVQALVTFGSMVADIVDEHELKTGKRQEGIFFASVSFSGKFTTGIGNVVGGIALDLISWPRGVAIQTAADVPADTIIWLGLVYGPIVAGFAAVSVWCYSKHHLDRRRHGEIVAALSERRSASEIEEDGARVTQDRALGRA